MTSSTFSIRQYAGSEWSLLFQGAESRVYRGVFHSKPAILKERFKKTYRLDELDQKLTKERIRSELKAYQKIEKKCPDLFQNMCRVLHSDERNIVFTKLTDTISVKEYFDQSSEEAINEMLKKMGEVVAQIHLCGVIHGDLTTSNFLVKQQHKQLDSLMDNVVIPIDFGLSSGLVNVENQAVDLYVLERAIQSTNPKINFNHLLDSYQKKMETDKINKKLDQVRMRGRKRLMIG